MAPLPMPVDIVGYSGQRMVITVTPNPSIDRTLDVAQLTPGAVNRASAVRVEPSGKGVNVTRALLRNGIGSTAVLPIGGYEGTHLGALLEDAGVPYVGVPIAGAVRVNISLRGPKGVVTKVNEPGPSLSWAESEALQDAVVSRVGRGDWVVASGTLPGGVSESFYADLAEAVRRRGGRFAVDSSGEALRRALEGRPDLVKPNRTELAELVGRPLHTLGDVLEAAAQVRDLSGGVVLASLGADGALLVDGSGIAVHAEAPVGTVRSTVGAGDSLLAGYLSVATRSDRAGDSLAALREAVAWGSAAVRSTGSVGQRVTDAERRNVRLHQPPDPHRQLTA